MLNSHTHLWTFSHSFETVDRVQGCFISSHPVTLILPIPDIIKNNTKRLLTFTVPYTTYPEKAMAPHSSTLAWKIPWTEEPGSCSLWGCSESDTTEQLHFHFSLSCTGEGNGNPLQCSCLENPRDGGAWWAAVSGVAQSRTRLKRLSSSSSSIIVTRQNSLFLFLQQLHYGG